MDDITYSNEIAYFKRVCTNSRLLSVLEEAHMRLVADRAAAMPQPQPLSQSKEPADRKTYMRDLMRDKRAAAKLGITVAEYRQKEAKAPK